MQVVIPLVTLVLGAIFGAWYSVFFRRPKLEVVGSGSGGGPGPGYRSNYVRIRNQPGFLGLRLGETSILGRHVHRPIERGFNFDRAPAKECRGRIFDKETRELIAALWWRRVGDDSVWQDVVTIESGDSYQLAVFAALEHEPTRYFVYAPTSATDPTPIASATGGTKFEGTRNFRVEVLSYDRPKLAFDVKMRKSFDGRLYWESPGSGGSF